MQGNTSNGASLFGGDGGGIVSSCSSFTIQDGSKVTGNFATASGGGIYLAPYNGVTPTLTVTNSTISGNSAGGSGGGIELTGGSVAITSGTISGNSATGGNGGGIDISGTLTVSNSTISGNSAPSTRGGGIYNQTSGVLTITNSTLSGNYADPPSGFDSGAGIWNIGTLIANNCTFSGNSAGQAGGAIETVSGSTTPAVITDCIFSNNVAVYNGAGISGTGMTVSDCTFSGNTVTGGTQGGAAIAASGTLTVTNSTFSGNHAIASGGAIFLNNGTGTLSNSTISGNSSSGTGGGIDNTATLVLFNTIIAGNTAATDPDVVSPTTSGTNNLIGIGTGEVGLVGATNQVGTALALINPLLLPLGSYGGTLQTMPLLSGSPAINAGGNVTTLTTALTALATNTSVVVADAAAIASSAGSYVIQIDSEQMLVTAVNLATNTLTVQRAYNSTALAAHNAGAGVVLPQDEIGQTRVVAGKSSLGAVATVDTVTFTTQPPAFVAAGNTFTVAITVTSSNASSVTGIPFTLAISSNTISGTTSGTTNAAGLVTFSNLLVAKGGTYTLTALVNGGVSATSNSFVVGGVVATLSFSTEPPASLLAGATFTPVVLAVDSGDNPVANATITMTISTGSFSGPISAVTNAAGQATFSNLFVTKDGTYTLKAADGAINVVSTSFTIGARLPRA